MSSPWVTFIVPAFNAENTIGGTLSGLLTQTYPSFDIVVIDDGSTDCTGAIARTHPRTTVIRQDNTGLSGARNAGVAAARGEMLAWCDADDIFLPPYLSDLVATWSSAGDSRTIASSDALFLTPTGLSGKRMMPVYHPKPEDQALAFLRASFISGMCLYPRHLHDEVGMLDTSLNGGEDRDLWLRALLRGWHAVKQPKPNALYRWTGTSLSSNGADMEASEKFLLEKALRESSEYLTEEQRDLIQTMLTGGTPRQLLSEGNESLRQGDYKAARAALGQASRLSPLDRRLQLRALAARTPVTCRILERHQRWADEKVGYNSDMRR
ncbi:MAG: glycosyltransferase family A protein [Dermatophilaceae bacterium]